MVQLDEEHWELKKKTQAAMRELLRDRLAAVTGAVYGPDAKTPYAFILDGIPPPLVWAVTLTDAERDRLKTADGIVSDLRAVMQASGYPIDQPMFFNFESEETVSRDYDGHWQYAIK